MTHRTIITAGAATIGVLLAFLPEPVRADIEYPWCGYMNMFQGQQQSCTFSTLEQCRAFVTTNGYCDANPRGALARTTAAPVAAPARRR